MSLSTEYQNTLRAHEQALLRWTAECREPVFEDPETLVERAESEADLLDYVRDIADHIGRALTAEQTRLRGHRDDITQRRKTLVTQREQLSSDVDPPHRHTARPTAKPCRAHRSGVSSTSPKTFRQRVGLASKPAARSTRG